VSTHIPEDEPTARIITRFIATVRELSPGRALEIGSRARSGITRRQWIPGTWEYIGFDVLPGENVDITGDAHQLSRLILKKSVDVIYAISVFEHLLMPWKVVIEINRILKRNGLVLIQTHQAWPVHESPWDYYRFSDQAWKGLFNRQTGFEIIESAMGEQASIRALHPAGPTIGIEDQPAYLSCVVLAQKVARCKVRWKVDAADLVTSPYPS
jgi:hypothetical protein